MPSRRTLACTTSCIGSSSSCSSDSGGRGKVIGDKTAEHVCVPSNISSRPTHLYLCMMLDMFSTLDFFDGFASDGSHVRDARDGLRLATSVALPIATGMLRG
jgi:hypothetical protein